MPHAMPQSARYRSTLAAMQKNQGPKPAASRPLSGLMVLAGLTVATPVMAQEPVDIADAAPDQAVIAPAPADTAQHQAAPASAPADEVAFEADEMEYDFETEIVTARGNVQLSQENYRLWADRIVWNRNTGEVTAQGNIRARGADGEMAYGDSIQLSDDLRNAVVDNLLLVLSEGGRIAARRGARTEDIYSLEQAAYTPCKVETKRGCPKEPTWQIKAVKVIYNARKKRVTYVGARIELFGLPIIPLPGLSHPVGGGAGSGLLVPDIRFSQSNGVEFAQPYYLRIAENRDLTLTGHVFTDVLPMLGLSYRALTERGAYRVNGHITNSRRISTDATAAATQDTGIRGYVDSSGQFQLNENWSMSHSLRLASDRTFLRRYDISREDRLRSTFAAQRVDDDSYFSLSGWAVQTLRAGQRQGLVPIALPELDYRRRLTDPLLGGIAQLQVNSLAIARTSGQDSQRAFASARWDLRKITRLGQEVNFTLLGRGDIYHSDENDLTDTLVYRGRSGWQGRGIFAAAVDVKWPLVGSAFGGIQTLTPRVQLVAAPTISNLRVPNEDSRAVDLEESNLFAINRFPGYDRFEDNYRLTIGVDWSLRRDDFTIDATIGQSVRLDNRATIFPDGTGLSEKVSDFVGRTEIRFKDLVRFTHRFRLDKDNLAIRRNEIDATVGTQGTYLKVGYLKLNRDIGPAIEDLQDREEIRLGGRVTLHQNWSLFGSTIIDLTSARESPLSMADGYDPIRHRLGISYDDECLSLGLTWRRDYEPTGDARRGNTFLLRLAFRQLGV